MSTAAEFRRLALALPDVVEGAHHGHPDFRAGGRVIASLHPGDRQAMVRVDAATQQRLVATNPTAFAPANGAWGRAGCTIVTLAEVDRELLREVLTTAWQHAVDASAGKGRRKTTPKTTTPRRGPTVSAARRRRRPS